MAGVAGDSGTQQVCYVWLVGRGGRDETGEVELAAHDLVPGLRPAELPVRLIRRGAGAALVGAEIELTAAAGGNAPGARGLAAVLPAYGIPGRYLVAVVSTVTADTMTFPACGVLATGERCCPSCAQAPCEHALVLEALADGPDIHGLPDIPLERWASGGMVVLSDPRSRSVVMAGRRDADKPQALIGFPFSARTFGLDSSDRRGAHVAANANLWTDIPQPPEDQRRDIAGIAAAMRLGAFDPREVRIDPADVRAEDVGWTGSLAVRRGDILLRHSWRSEVGESWVPQSAPFGNRSSGRTPALTVRFTIRAEVPGYSGSAWIGSLSHHRPQGRLAVRGAQGDGACCVPPDESCGHAVISRALAERRLEGTPG